MREFRGISASPGIAIQHAFVHFEDTTTIPRYTISEDEVDQEIIRFEEALARAASEIKSIKEGLPENAENQIRLLDAQLFMLYDPDMEDRVKVNVTKIRHNVEWVLAEYVDEMVRILESSKDEYLAERSVDILDVTRRLTNHLLYREHINLGDLEREIILVTPTLMPSETILINPTKVRGIAMDAGGRTSHTAILARSFGIPAVVGLRDLSRRVKPEDLLIVDGNIGTVVVDPDEDTLLRYRKILEQQVIRESVLVELKELPAETKDGKRILLKANIEIPDEIESVKAYNAEGIGLFRSEFLFMDPNIEPDEERQYSAYVDVLEAMGDLPVTIRTLDVGGDKLIPGVTSEGENNPLLGWRAIRYCLGATDVFRTQLRALLRASAHGNLRIMFPLISSSGELERAREMLFEERESLLREGLPVAEKIPVGIMIEVPSAALTADILAKGSDFFSIGTNDLIQYTLAVDRGNEKVASLYQPYHPGILRLLETTVEAAHDAGISVGLCGEMAADPISTLILLGLGLDELSMGAFSIPVIKRIIRSVTLEEAEESLAVAIGMSTNDDIDKYLREWMGKRFDFTDR